MQKRISSILHKVLLAVIAVSLAGLLFVELNFKRNNDHFNYVSVAKEHVVDHVVRIDILMHGVKVSGGTGFHMKYADKVVLITNKHVCDPTLSGATLATEDQDFLRIVKIDTRHDLCLIESNRKSGLTLAYSDADVLDEVILVGHPRGLPMVIRHGHIMSHENISFPWIGPHKVKASQMSTTSYGGSSGSPVVNKHGRVVDVLFAGYRNYNTEGFMVPWLDLAIFLGTTL